MEGGKGPGATGANTPARDQAKSGPDKAENQE